MSSAVVAIASACDAGPLARPSFDRPTTADASVVDAGGGDEGMIAADASRDAPPPAVVYAVCPDAMAPTFTSIFAAMFATRSCGANQSFDCHSTNGASALGNRNGVDFSLDAAAVYAELLGADGGGQPSTNVQGNAGGPILRVVPGAATASMLFIKLALPTNKDPRYGNAMPPQELVCPAALDAVRAWIDRGAAAN